MILNNLKPSKNDLKRLKIVLNGLKPSKTTQNNQPKFFSASNYVFKFVNRNTRTSGEICLKFTIKTPERRHWRLFGVYIVNFEHTPHLVLVFLLLTLSR